METLFPEVLYLNWICLKILEISLLDLEKYTHDNTYRVTWSLP